MSETRMGEATRAANGSAHRAQRGRTLVVGLSGCSWNVLDPLLATGQLPNLASMVEAGCSGVLESVVPFQPAPAWASYATGTSPGAHGTYDLLLLDSEGLLRPVRGSELRTPTYFQQLGHEGRRSVLVNLPIDLDGCDGAVIVNSWLTAEERRRILPVGRRERYQRLLAAYRALPSNPHDVDELCALEEARFDLARELYLREDWDHFFLLFSATDWLGHVATGSLLAGDADAKAAFLRLYRQLDRYIGWLVEHAPDAWVFVLSEHGQAEERALLRVNTILQQMGLVEIVRREEARHEPAPTGRRHSRRFVTVPTSISRFRANSAVRPLALATRSAARGLLGIQLTSPTYGVDTARSEAFSPTDASFAVYLRDSADHRDAIVDALRSVSLHDGGPAVDGVWPTEELWGRERHADEPALLFAPARGVRPSAAVKDRPIDFPSARGHGCHDRDGILLVTGPGCPAESLARASICDLAATLLALMGTHGPAHAEGRVLQEVLGAASASEEPLHLTSRTDMAIPFDAPGEQHDEVTRRLKALGYL